MAVLICAGLALTLPRIGKSICYDEACTVDFVKLVPGNITDMLAGGNNLPAYYFFMKAWTTFSGFGETALRLPGIIIYLLAVVLVYLFGKRIFSGYGPAFVSAVFYLLMWINTFEAGLARPYSMLAFLCVASLWLFYEIFIMENKSRFLAALFIIVNVTGTLTHIWFFFAGFAQVIYHLKRKKGMGLRDLTVFAASYLPFFAVWGGALYSQLQNHASDFMVYNGNVLVRTLQVYTFTKFHVILFFFSLPVIAGVLMGKYLQRRQNINGNLLEFLMIILFASLVVPYLISFIKPIYMPDRGPIIAAAPFALLMAGYLCSISYRPFFYAVFAFFTVYNYIMVYPFVQVDFYNERNMAKLVMYDAPQADTVAIYGEMKRPIHYYLDLYKYKSRAVFVYYPNIMESINSRQWEKFGEKKTAEIEKKYYDLITGNGKRVLLVFTAREAFYAPLKRIIEKLNAAKTMVKSQTFFGETLVLYE